jgi:VWFA-related protein
MRVIVAVALSLAGAAATSFTQFPSTAQPTFRAGVDVVQVDVSVLDKDRKPVRGLTAADFTIREDGNVRPVVAFIPVDLGEREVPSGAAPWLLDVSRDVTTNSLRPEGRLVVIMFDWSIRFEDQILARRIATAAINQLGPDDLAAVVFTSGFANGGVPQNFTADRARLLEAVNRPFAMTPHNPPKGSPFHDPRNENGVMIDDPEGYESGDCYCRMCVPEAIARVADTVRDVRGRRKTLLFIGTYVRLYESLQGPSSRQGPAFTPGLGGKPVVHPGVCSAYLKTAREKMTRATSMANLTIHAIDPVGLESEGNSPMGGPVIGQIDRRNDLAALADTTGGRAVLNTNAPETLVPAVFAETQSYYLLGFAPADVSGKSRFHKIEVKVNRRGVSVRTRAGHYTGETPAKSPTPAILSPDTAAALEGVLPRADVPLTVAVAPFAVPGKEESAVVVVLGVEQRPPASDATTQAIKVLAAAFDRNGRSVQSQEQTVTVPRPNAGGPATFEVLSRLTVKPGRYEVRVALEDGGDRRGSVFTFVDVPEFRKEPLALSGIAIGASPAPATAPRDAFASLLPVVPTAQRQFAATGTAVAFVRVYQRMKDAIGPVDLAARIVDPNGRALFDDALSLTEDRFTADGAADYRIALPLARLTPGEYLLTIDAARGKSTARRAVRFSMR